MRLCWLAVVLCVAAVGAEDELPWWKTAIFYQVYERSFKDSNGDGIGDLKGISQMAGYFKEIGVDAIWLNPFNKSPMKDFGYDISDFTAIESVYGTMEDYQSMVVELRRQGIKVVFDFVPNHTSDQHIWFKASSNTSHPLHQYYKDFYVWKPANGTTSEGKPIPPNNWLSLFSGPAWEWSDDRQMFYFHDFLKEQPDLNYRNPNVVSNMTAVLKYWLDIGVDGFRVDSSKFIFENVSYPNDPPIAGTNGSTYETLQHIYDTNQPETFQLITDWTDFVHQWVVQDGRPRAIFNEVYDDIAMAMKYYGTGNRTMDITFNFNLLGGGSPSARPADIKHMIDVWVDAMPTGAVANWVVGNHDNPRVSHSYGTEMVDAINMLTGVLPGVQCVYYGEEIGMENTFVLWNQTVDPRGRFAGPDHYMELSRDPQRTPMQWNDSKSAGFSTNSTTWLPANPNYWWLNVEAQRTAATSHLKVFQAMAKARKDPVLQRGDLKTLVPNESTLLIVRSYNGSYFLLIINMASEIATYTSQNLFAPNGLDVDMTVVVASVNSGYSTGVSMKKGSLSVSLRPKAAIVLRSGSSSTSAGARSLVSTVLLVCTLLTVAVLRR